MKLVIAIISPHKLADVREALLDIGVVGLTVTEVKGYGRQKGHTELFRGAEYVIDFVAKLRLEILIPASSLDLLIDTLIVTARTGKIGDGKIFVLEPPQAIRVRTGETGLAAL